MSKGNLFLGQGRGKVGDIVFYRLAGEQVTRARNRSPKNPQTPMQLAQRVIMNTVSKAYSLFKPLADHSFQGLAEGSENQRQFIKDNTDLLRLKCAEVFADPEEWETPAGSVYNFNPKSYIYPVLNDYYISRGQINSLTVVSANPVPVLTFLSQPASANMTYAEVVSCLGVQRGDQLTFVVATHDGRFGYNYRSELNGLRFARVILDPSNGDMSVPFLSGGAVNFPNEKNEGDVQLSIENVTIEDVYTGFGMKFRFADVSEATTAPVNYGGATVIASRWNGSSWLRSTQQLVPCFTGGYAEVSDVLLYAIQSYMSDATSSLYLNQSDTRDILPSGQARVVSAALSRSTSLIVMSRGGTYQVTTAAHVANFIGGGFTSDSMRVTKDGVNLSALSLASDSARYTLEGEGTYIFYVNGDAWCTVIMSGD